MGSSSAGGAISLKADGDSTVNPPSVAATEKSRSLPAEAPIFRENGLALYADPRNAAELGRHNTLSGHLKSHFARMHGGTKAGDYVGLLAYIQRDEAHIDDLDAFGGRMVGVALLVQRIERGANRRGIAGIELRAVHGHGQRKLLPNVAKVEKELMRRGDSRREQMLGFFHHLRVNFPKS